MIRITALSLESSLSGARPIGATIELLSQGTKLGYRLNIEERWRFDMKYILPLYACLLLASCALEPDAGNGPIILSERVEAGFEKYKGEQDPRYFAVSLNGQQYGYSACSGPKCLRDGQNIALEKCQARVSELMSCKIFAHGQEIVWNGPVHFRSSGEPDPAVFGDTPYFFGPVYD